MEPLTALGLACNIMQAIDYSRKAIRGYKEITKNGSTSANKDIYDRSGQIKKSSEGILVWLGQHQSSSKPLTVAESELQDVANQCVKIADTLRKKLAPLEKYKQGSKRAVWKMSLKMILDNDMNDMELQLSNYESVLQTKILTHLNAKEELHFLEQQDRLKELDTTLVMFIQRVAEGFTNACDLIRDEATMTQQLVLQQGKSTRDHLDRTLQDQNSERLTKVQYDRLLDSLRYPEINARRNAIAENHRRTFEWIYDEYIHEWSPFVPFLEGSEKMYWIRGKPGSGKSCLMKFVFNEPRTIEALGKWKPQGSIRLLSHFFWNSGTKSQRSLHGFLLSLTYQLLRDSQDIAGKLISAHQRISEHRNNDDWSESELLRVIKQLAGSHSNPVCIFIDGLDEVDQEYGNLKLIALVQELALLENVKICVSSRPEMEFRSRWYTCPKLKLEDLTREDMKVLARDLLQNAHCGRLAHLEPRDLQRWIDTIVFKAEGVFLWAVYAIKSLSRGLLGRDSWEEMHQRLKKLPDGIVNLYRTMWKRLNEDEELWREDAAWYFRLVSEYDRSSLLAITLAKHASLREEIIQNLRVCDWADLKSQCLETEQHLLVRCAGLLEVTGGTASDAENTTGIWGHVDFIHRSARDFLYETIDGQAILQHSAISDLDSCRIIIRTHMAWIVVRQSEGSLFTSDVVLVLECLDRYLWLNVLKEEVLEMFIEFVQFFQDLRRNEGVVLHRESVTDVIGCTLKRYPSLGFTFIQEVLKDYELNEEYAIYLLSCAATACSSNPGDRGDNDLVFKTFRFLLNKGANPNVRLPVRWPHDPYYYVVSLFEWCLLDSVCAKPSEIERILELLIEFGFDANQTMWLDLGPINFEIFGKGLEHFAPSLIVKCNLSQLLSMFDINRDKSGIVYSALSERSMEAVYIYNPITSSPPERPKSPVLLKPTAESDVVKLNTALHDFEELSEQGGVRWHNQWGSAAEDREERNAAWERTVGLAIEEIRGRCQVFRGDDDLTELARAGILVSRDTLKLPEFHDEIIEQITADRGKDPDLSTQVHEVT